MAVTKFDEMTEEERLVAFQTWLASRATKKASRDNQKRATRELIRLHKAEYDRLVAGRPAAAPKA